MEQFVKPQKDLCENSSNPIVFFNQKGKIVFGNTAIQKLGVKNKDLKGKNVWDFLGGKSRKLILDIIESRKAGTEKLKFGAPHESETDSIIGDDRNSFLAVCILLNPSSFHKRGTDDTIITCALS